MPNVHWTVLGGVSLSDFTGEFQRQPTPEAKAKYAGHFMDHLAQRIEFMWPFLYEGLDLIRAHEIYRQLGHDSFEQYCETKLGGPFSKFQELENTYHYASIARPELFRVGYQEAIEESKQARIRNLAASDPHLTQQQIAGQVGCDQSYVSRVMTKTSSMDNSVIIPDWLKSPTSIARFRRLPPEAQERVRRKESKVQTEAIAAGIYTPPTTVQVLQRYWRKATKAERRTFLAWTERETD